MADYYVRVRDYHWSHQNTVVQSPILDLNTPPPAPIIRPLEGIHRHEPRIIDNITDLRDDIQSDEYRAEAHGVFVLTDPRNPNRFPVWVPVQSYKCKAGEVYIVNLTSCEASSIAIAKICWVPGLEGPDGSLYTVIGCPRETLRATKVMVLVQKLGLPREAKLVVIDPTQLAEYGKIEDSRKKALFEIQTRFIRTRSNPPSCITLNVCRILTSPDRNNRGRLGFDEVLDEDSEVPWASHSDCSSQSSFTSSGDDDSPYVKPTYVSLVRGSNRRPYDCDCKYIGLRPTYFNPRPPHRHCTDEECSLGSKHTKHCIFADYSPTKCVILDSREQHEHCVPPPQDYEALLKQGFGDDCFAAAEALYEEAERGIYNTFAPMDLEPSYTDTPSIKPQSTPSPRLTSTRCNKSKVTKRLRGRNSVARPAHRTIRNARINCEAYGSPEPKDMEF